MTARPTEHPAADVLRVLAVSRSSGALEIRGTPSGTIFLHAGEITFAEATGLASIPDDPQLRLDPQLRSMVQQAIVEAGLTLLTESSPDNERPLFRPGRRHWTGLVCRLGVESWLGEIDRQLESFTRLGVDPDDDVQLRPLPRGHGAVLDRRQWALAAAITQPQSARSLSRRAGVPLSATIATVASLVEVGVLEFGVADGEPALITPDVMREPGAAIRELVRRQSVDGGMQAFPGLSGPGAPPGARPPRRNQADSELPPGLILPGTGPLGLGEAGPAEPDDEPPTRQNPTSATETPPPQSFSAPLTPPQSSPPQSSPPAEEERLPHRIRGATSLPAAAPEPDRTIASGYDNSRESGQALAMRLLEGLRRL